MSVVTRNGERACAACGTTVPKYVWDTETKTARCTDCASALGMTNGGEPLGAGVPSSVDFLSQMHGSPGFVVDEAVARESSCIGYALKGKGTEPDLVFTHGIVGALDADQRETYCSTGVVLHDLTPKQKARLAAFKDSSAVCKTEIAEVPKGERLEPWLGCMSAELRKRGERP